MKTVFSQNNDEEQGPIEARLCRRLSMQYHTCMGRIALLKEFWGFLRVRKKFWLLPIVIMLLFLGALIIFTEGSALSPFIYILF